MNKTASKYDGAYELNYRILQEALKKAKTQTPEEARKDLQRSGILNKNGNVCKPYRHVISSKN